MICFYILIVSMIASQIILLINGIMGFRENEKILEGLVVPLFQIVIVIVSMLALYMFIHLILTEL